jgi:hypothetical protein
MPPDELRTAVEQAIANLPEKSVAMADGLEFELRRLYPVSSWLPFSDAPDRGLAVIGEDSCGNQFLYSPDGCVLFWDHETDDETFLAKTINEFLGSLSPPAPVELQPGQVISAWINPAFLEEQRRKANAAN